MPDGAPSVGAPARKESSRLVLLRSACGSLTDHRSGSGTRVSSIYPARRFGSSANTGRRREKILSRHSAGEGRTAHLGGHHQGAMDLRAGAPAAQRRTRPRSLRRPVLAGPAPPCADDDDRLRFPSVSPAQNSKAGKKESTGRHLSRHCPPCVRPFSNLSPSHQSNGARIAEDGFATRSGVSKSAKVVLGARPDRHRGRAIVGR